MSNIIIRTPTEITVGADTPVYSRPDVSSRITTIFLKTMILPSDGHIAGSGIKAFNTNLFHRIPILGYVYQHDVVDVKLANSPNSVLYKYYKGCGKSL